MKKEKSTFHYGQTIDFNDLSFPKKQLPIQIQNLNEFRSSIHNAPFDTFKT